MTSFDPRVTPARPDLAARHLQGRIAAAHFVDGVPRQVIDAVAPLRRHPAPDAPLDTEALYGESVTVYETTEEGWCWGQLDADRYVGWLPANALGPPAPEATHKVTALRTLVFPGPSIKAPPTAALPLGARVAIARMQDAFAVTASGGFLPARHLAPLDTMEQDLIAVAERFTGTPYLWGGRTSLGIDCSGLVQVALTACGISCPRDSDMQEAAIGTAVDWRRDIASLRRGDLVFWKGHVAVVSGNASLLHANAHHMATVAESIADALARIAAAGSAVTSVKRLQSVDTPTSRSKIRS